MPDDCAAHILRRNREYDRIGGALDQPGSAKQTKIFAQALAQRLDRTGLGGRISRMSKVMYEWRFAFGMSVRLCLRSPFHGRGEVRLWIAKLRRLSSISGHQIASEPADRSDIAITTRRSRLSCTRAYCAVPPGSDCSTWQSGFYRRRIDELGNRKSCPSVARQSPPDHLRKFPRREPVMFMQRHLVDAIRR